MFINYLKLQLIMPGAEPVNFVVILNSDAETETLLKGLAL